MRADPRFKPLPLEVTTLLAEGQAADAIKVLQHTDGSSLRVARARIEAHIAQDPLLRVQFESQRRATRRRLFLWFLLIDLGITAGLIYWFITRGQA
jgi:hypothetical protein